MPETRSKENESRLRRAEIFLYRLKGKDPHDQARLLFEKRIGLLGMTAGALFVIQRLLDSHSSWWHSGKPFWFRSILTAHVWEALLAAWILARLVDPYVKERLIGEVGDRVGERARWSWFPRIPQVIRDALDAKAKTDQYLLSSTWKLKFAWHSSEKKLVHVEMKCVADGECVSRPYKPPDTSWAMSSLTEDGTQLTAWHWDVHGTDAHIELGKDDLLRLKAFTRADDGGIDIDQAKLIQAWVAQNPGVAVECPTDGKYTSSKTVEVVRGYDDLIPLIHVSPLSKLTVEIRGPSDLVFRIFADGGWTEVLPMSDQGGPIVRRFNAILPREATFVSWRPKTGTSQTVQGDGGTLVSDIPKRELPKTKTKSHSRKTRTARRGR